jgi:hypothetical protein
MQVVAFRLINALLLKAGLCRENLTGKTQQGTLPCRKFPATWFYK